MSTLHVPSVTPSVVADGRSKLVNSYCVAHSLVNGVQYNGKECFVAKVDPQNPDRVVVIFTDMLSKPDFVSLRPQNLTRKYDVEVRPSSIPNAGLGLFATRDYKAGEIILTEKGFMEVPDAVTATDNSTTPAAYKAAIERHATRPVLEVLEQLSATSNAHTLASARGGEWGLRMGANALSALTPRSDTSILYPILCRINHACLYTKECNVWWDADATRTLTAARDIKAGEELLTEYCDMHLYPAMRKQKLLSYGIRVCGADEKEEDKSAARAEAGASSSSSPASSSRCVVCCDPKAHALFVELNAALGCINRLSSVCLPALTGDALPPLNVTRQWIAEGIAHCVRCNEICEKIGSMLSPPSDFPLRGRLANHPRNEAQKMLLAMLFQAAVSYQQKEYANTLYKLLIELFTSQLIDELRQHGGNDQHPLFIAKETAIERSIMNTNEFMKHVPC